MKRDDLEGCPYVAVISGWRPKNVAKMSAIIGPATWYVPEDQVQHYLSMGAAQAIGSGGLCRSRNAALGDAFKQKLPCIELSDDLTKLTRAYQATATKNKAKDISFPEAVWMLRKAAEQTGAFLAGCAPTNNPFYWNPARNIQTAHFIVGDFIWVQPCDLRFNEDLRLKEDYDYTLQHLQRHGKVARRNDLLPHFAHRSNKGGAVKYRTSSLEQKTISQLKELWPDFIRDNPRRPDEILMRWS